MEKMSEKTLRTYMVVSILLNLWLALMWNKSNMEYKQLEVKTDSLDKKCDSLNSEVFQTTVNLGRYEIAHEILKERNPKASSQLDDIISKETE